MLWRTAGPEGDLQTRAGPADTVPYRALLVALRRFLRSEGAVYLDDPDVCSIGIGYKRTRGRRTPELCVQFTVVDKRRDLDAPDALGRSLVPPSIPIAGMEVPTDGVERRDRRA